MNEREFGGLFIGDGTGLLTVAGDEFGGENHSLERFRQWDQRKSSSKPSEGSWEEE